MFPDPRTGPVTSRLVHKRLPAEVLFAEYRLPSSSGTLHLTPAPQWGTHERWGAPEDAALHVAEALRQAVILYAHLAHGVPLGTAFVMERMVFRTRGDEIRRTASVTASTQTRIVRGDRLISMVAEVRFLADDGDEYLFGEGHLRVIPEAVYRRMRLGRTTSDELSTPQIPRGFEIDPLPEGGALLRYDTKDPLFFDHPVDHVPGMLLIAAALRVFFAETPAGSAFGVNARFDDYLELNESRAVAMRIHAPASVGEPLLSAVFGAEQAPAAVIELYAPSATEDDSASDGVAASMSPS